jgi:DNA-binding NarL/FixJ family response regulator
MIFTVPSHWRVFVLDDTEDRLRWFRERLQPAACVREAKTAQHAIEILSAEAFDLVFLDHDLSWADAGFPDKQFGNGKEVARYLAIAKFAGRVVIHSKNEAGVAAMKKVLPQATIARFDDFDIVIASSAPAAAALR